MTTPQRDGIPKSPFSEWIRNNKALDSKATGLAVYDFDWVVRKRWIETSYGHETSIQNLMVIEEKRCGKQLGDYQQDTIAALQQMLATPESRNTPAIYNIRMPSTGEIVTLRYFGYHILTFYGKGPVDSDRIDWDGKRVDTSTLESILRFELCPFTLKKMRQCLL